MKLSKALLGAMLAGVAAQAVATSGCTHKAKTSVKPQTETPSQQAENQQPSPAPASNPDPNQEPCPACGMG